MDREAIHPASEIYCFLAPHFWVLSIQTPPAFSQSALSFAVNTPAKAGGGESGCKSQSDECQEKPLHGVSPFVMLAD
jgi:hypothetical protein